MATSVGSRAYLCLGKSFETPHWREALVAKTSESGWFQVVVRARREAEVKDQYSSFKIGGRTFFLVELECHQLRAFHGDPCLALDTEAADLLQKAGSLLNSDTEQLTFATASEQDAPSGPSRQKKPERRESKSESSDSSSDGADFLEQLQKKWLVGDIAGGSSVEKKKGKKDKKGGYTLLTKSNSRKKEEKDREVSVQDIIAGMVSGTDPLKTLVALQLTDRLKKDRRRARRHRTRSDSSRSSKVSSSSSDSNQSSRSHRHRRTGHAKAIESYQASKRRMFRRPLHHIKKYVKEVERELGAEDGKPYNLTDMGRKVSWGKQRNLQRCHFLLSDILEKLLRGKTEEGTLQVVLGLRAVHQAAIDGEWTVAWMLTHLPDVWSKKQWGGDPEDLGNVANYLRSMQELNRSTERLRNSASSSTADPVDPLPPEKQKQKGKGKGKEEEKTEGQ